MLMNLSNEPHLVHQISLFIHFDYQSAEMQYAHDWALRNLHDQQKFLIKYDPLSFEYININEILFLSKTGQI